MAKMIHEGDYSRVDIRDYDIRDDKVILLKSGQYEFDIDSARKLAMDILASCQLAESHFRKEEGYADDEVLTEEQRATLPAICVHEPSPGIFVQVRIVSAANIWGTVKPNERLREALGLKEEEPLVIPSSRHSSILQHILGDEIKRLRAKAGEESLSFPHGSGQGFIDQWDRYWNREDAFVIAKHAGQINATRPNVIIINNELYSENLY